MQVIGKGIRPCYSAIGTQQGHAELRGVIAALRHCAGNEARRLA
jgi:D-mannonate dehydratase